MFIADVKNVEIINKCRLFLKFNKLIHEWSEEKTTNIPQKIKNMIAPLNKKLMYALLMSMMSLSAAMGQTIKKSPVDYVDNFIGVRDMNTSCVLGPQLPNASINPSPHTNPGKVNYDMDGYVMGQPIRGFAQLHVSGTGWGKYGQVFLSPQTGLATGAKAHDSEAENEIAKPVEYGVQM